MQVNAANGTSPYINGQAPQLKNNSMNADLFMQMLMAQLSNQNPLEPMKDSDMMAQFTQMNSVQELQSIRLLMDQSAISSRTGYAAALIGKTVRLNLPDGETAEGVVTGVTIEKNKVYVEVNGQKAPLDNVVEISAPTTGAAQP